jgi:hypothetical protein
MRNPTPDLTAGVAFAQPPATSLNPYRIKTNSVKAEQKSWFGRNIERRKMSLVSFCVRFFCPFGVRFKGINAKSNTRIDTGCLVNVKWALLPV